MFTALISRLATHQPQVGHQRHQPHQRQQPLPRRPPLTPRWALGCALLAAAAHAPLAQAFSGDWAGTNGQFSVVTYNVGGLPAVLGSTGKDPAKTTPEMGRRLLRFDLVKVQEDFNYHKALYSTTTSFAYRTATSGGVPFGSGLNTLSAMTVNGLQRIKWRKCRADSCLTPKGFTFERVMVGQGAYLDSYNLHTQAGSSAEDIAVRRDNMLQLAQFINWRSAGNAVVVAGDTNMRYTRQGENIREFLAMTGLTDTFVQSQLGGVAPAVGPDNVCPKGSETNACEVVDKVFYRAGRDIELQMAGYSNEDRNFLDTDGRPLSDHRPVAAWFNWRQKEARFELAAEHSGKCLNVSGVSQSAGAALIQWDCQPGNIFRGHMLFRQIDDTLRVAHTGMCLNVEGASRSAGARVIQWPCVGAANERVRFEGNRVVFQHSGMCLKVAGASSRNGAQLVQWPCGNHVNERFTRRY